MFLLLICRERMNCFHWLLTGYSRPPGVSMELSYIFQYFLDKHPKNDLSTHHELAYPLTLSQATGLEERSTVTVIIRECIC